jgi:hypothetical protein
MMPFVYRFWNGAVHIRFNEADDLGFLDLLCFVCLPPGFQGKTIPNQFIHEPHYNSAPVNKWWAGYRLSKRTA